MGRLNCVQDYSERYSETQKQFDCRNCRFLLRIAFFDCFYGVEPLDVDWIQFWIYPPSAALIIIFITDAEDTSEAVNPTLLMSSLLALKNNDTRRVLAYGAIIPSSVSGCPRDPSGIPVRIEQFLNMVPNGKDGGGPGGNVVSLCAPDFGQKLAGFALQIVDTISSVIYLSRLPDPDSLRVSYGSIDLPMDPKTGWSYSSAENAIYLGPDIDWVSQPPGSKVEVHYKEARGTR